jgi:hypothetical protein
MRREFRPDDHGQAPAEVVDLTVQVLANAYLTNRVISIDGGIHPR